MVPSFNYVIGHTVLDSQLLLDHLCARGFVHADRIFIREKCDGHSTCPSVEPMELHGDCEILNVVNMCIMKGMRGVAELILPGPDVVLYVVLLVELSYDNILHLGIIINITTRSVHMVRILSRRIF